MATKKSERSDAKGPRARQQKEKGEEKQGASRYLPYAAAVVVMIVIAAIAYFAFTNYVTVPFPTFKSAFLSAPRVSITATFANNTQFNIMNPCITSIIQFVAHTRNASTIDFFLVNSANATCTYSPSGLGHAISNITTQSAIKCIAVARSEPSLFLNFSSYNSTTITPIHMYAGGNAGYMSACPIASDLG